MKLAIFYMFFALILHYILKRYKVLSSYNGSNHQRFTNDAVTLSGGILVYLPSLIVFSEFGMIFQISISLLFFLGLLSDANYLYKPKLRLFYQFIILAVFVLSLKVEVLPTRIDFIDNNFQNSFFSYFFSVFCLLVLINGSNFIDGLNGLLLGYIILLFLFVIKLEIMSLTGINLDFFYQFIFILILILILNFCNFLFLGDNGSYTLSFLVGYYLIVIYNESSLVSPYFIILLLWYPCFENLFSIIRKNISKNDPLNADNKHLHHYLYVFLKGKFKTSKLCANNFTSVIINSFNFVIFYFGSNFYQLTYVQLWLIVFCITIYLLTYFFLKKKLTDVSI